VNPRAILRSLAAAAVAVLLAAGPAAAATHPDQWLQPNHDAGRTRANLGESILTPSTVKAGLTVSTVELGLSNTYATPVVEGGSFYAMSNAWDGVNGRLYRYDLATHDPVWRVDTECADAPMPAGAALLEGSTCGSTYRPQLQALNTTDGSLRYSAGLLPKFINRGLAYLNAPPKYLHPKNEVTAVDASTGAVLWRAPTPSEGLGYPLLAAGNTLYVGRVDSIAAWNAETGALRWSRQWPADPHYPTAAEPHALYVRYFNGKHLRMKRIDPATGEDVWDRVVYGTLALTPTVIYQVVPHGMRARDAKTGDLLWRSTGADGVRLGAPVYAAGVVWASSSSGYMYAFDATDGSFIGRWLTAPSENFVVAEGHVLIPSSDGRVFILSPSSG
jgi:outer membrane protein assembly factor BamB